MTSLNETLKERGSRYGKFSTHALITQDAKTAVLGNLHARLVATGVPDPEASAILEAAEMILHKLGRIANGDPTYVDSWEDLAGYAMLVVKILRGEEEDGAEQ